MPGIYNKNHLRTDSFPFFSSPTVQNHTRITYLSLLKDLLRFPPLGGNTHGGNSSMRRPLHPSGIGLLTLLSLLLLG